MIFTKIKNNTVDFAKKQYGFFNKVVSEKLAKEIAAKFLGTDKIKIVGTGGIFRDGFTFGDGLIKVHICKSYLPNNVFADTLNQYPHGYVQVIDETSANFYYKDETVFVDNEY